MSASPVWLLGVLFLPFGAGTGSRLDPALKAVTLRGNVLTLNAALAVRGLSIKVDPEPIAKQVVLVAEDGSVIPLFSDEASRALFLDDRLHARRAQLLGRRFAGLPYLQVISFKVEHQGKFQTPEYYCNVCAIHVRYPQTCPCCQGPMELRMQPDGE